VSGGWAEIPGYQPTIHNTHNAIRAIRAGQAAGLCVNQVESSLDRGRQWFLTMVGRHTPKSTLELSFAVRLGAELDLLQHERIEELARQLTRRRQTLSPRADLYAETEVSAIALIECSRRLDKLPDASRLWEWRWQLPTVPPPFLARGTYLYELLYNVVKRRWSLRAVDAIVEAKIIERVTALLLGTITSLGIIDDQIVNALSSRGDLRADLTIVTVGILLLLWLGVKTTALSSALLAAYTSIASLGVAMILTWMLMTVGLPFAAVVSITGLRWLVIDVVAYAADSSGLLDRLIPKNS